MSIKTLRNIIRFGIATTLLSGLLWAGLALGPHMASADACSINGLNCYIGYFYGGYDGGAAANGTRWNVLPAPALLNVNSGWDLVHTIYDDLGDCPGNALPSQTDQRNTGAAFIVLTMLGWAPGTPKNMACDPTQFNKWSTLVYKYEAAVPSLVNFNQVYDFGGINTRSTKVDVAYYPSNGAAPAIVFYDQKTGQPRYAIKRDCGNPIGELHYLEDLNYSLQPSVNVNPSGTVEPGSVVNFTYNVTNNPSERTSDPATCTIYTIVRNGYVGGTPPPGPGDPTQNIACPPIQQGQTYTIPISDNFTAQPNKTYCRELAVSPANQSGGGTATSEACVIVVSKPYAQVFGGDVSAGNGFGTACIEDTNASVVGWNQRAGTFAGAGTQYAAYVLNVLQDFASAQNSSGAPTPSGLAFANQNVTGGDQTNGTYGKSIGSSLPCVPDYAGQMPSSASSVGAVPPGGLTVSSLGGGAYKYNGNLTIAGGSLGTSANTTLYVTGDVYIKGNIAYTGSWLMNQIPNFNLIVKGNIYIAGAVTQLDGSYVSQQTGGIGGTIYTCTDPATPFTPMSLATPGNTVYTNCANKLTVNGSFTAQQIELLRSNGTLARAKANDTNTSNSAAEVFNYNPALWIAQPLSGSSTANTSDTYDSIVSLPPVL